MFANFTETAATELAKLGKVGVIRDVKPHLLPPEAWSSANNVVFDENGVSRAKGHETVLGSMLTTPEFIMNVPGVDGSFWFYCSLTKAYVVSEGSHANITRNDGEETPTDINYTANAGRDWNGTIFGGIPIINNGSDAPQFWPSLETNVQLEDLPAFEGPGATPLRARVIRTFGEYLVALNVTENSVSLSHAVYWSHKASPGTLPSSWDYTDPEVDAGRVFLTDAHGGEILDAGMLGDELIVYKEFSTHALRLSGGDDVMRPRMVLATSGLYAPRCFTAFDNGTKHFVVTSDDIIVHAGTRETQSVGRDRVLSLFKEIDPTNYKNSFVFENRVTHECWFCYPTVGNTYPNVAARWNYKNNTWSFRDFNGVSQDFGTITGASPGVWDDDTQVWDEDNETWNTESRTQHIFVDRTAAWQLETGYAFGNATPVAFCERLGLAIDGKDRFGDLKASFTRRKIWQRIWPKLTGVAQVVVQGGKQELLEGPVTWDTAQVFDPTTQRYLDSSSTPVNGLLLAQRFESNSNEPWTLEGIDLYIEPLGGL